MPWINSDEDTLNIMIFPWPTEMKETWFSPEHQALKRKSSEPARYFSYKGTNRQLPVDDIIKLLRDAEKRVTRVHMIVFPERALTKEDLTRLKLALKAAQDRDRMPMVVSGVRSKEDGELGTNRIYLSTFFAGTWYDLYQDKHHRWKLDPSQIKRYNLGGVLAGDKEWWEGVEVRERRITFLAPSGWLVLCPLICEDLARLEPVSELIRGVGPTLLIAILLDGPQLKQRWPSRYASVLADDPGTSVLTVSSLGMARHSTSPSGKEHDGTIALWKDQVGGLEEIALGEEEVAVVLTISAPRHKEYSADGRSDEGTSAVFALQGTHKLRQPVVQPEAKTAQGSPADREAKDSASGFRNAENIDIKELTIFTYLVDVLFDADYDLIDDIGCWSLGDESYKSDWYTKSHLKGEILDLIRKEINGNYAALLEGRYKAKSDFQVFVTIVSRVVKQARGKAEGNESRECDRLMTEWEFLIDVAENMLKNLEGSANIREDTVVALSILWAAYKRVANNRRELGLTSQNVKLCRRIEALLPIRYDDAWINKATEAGQALITYPGDAADGPNGAAEKSPEAFFIFD
jgi:hypothetical protein